MKTCKISYLHTLVDYDEQLTFNKKQICDLDSDPEFLLTQYNSNVTGAINYFVILSSNSSNPAVILWMFDTNKTNFQGVSNSRGCTEKDEVVWP